MITKVILYMIRKIKSKKNVDKAVEYLNNISRLYDKDLERIVKESKFDSIRIAALNKIRNCDILATFIKEDVLSECALKNIDSLKTLKELYYNQEVAKKCIHFDIKWKYVEFLKRNLEAINVTKEQIKDYTEELDKIEPQNQKDNRQPLTRDEIDANMDEGIYNLNR